MGTRDDVFDLRAPFARYRLRVHAFALPPADAAQAELRRQARLDLRVGIQWREPEVLRVALALDRALSGRAFHDFDGFGGVSSHSLSERQLESLAHRLTESFDLGRISVERESLPSLTDRQEPFTGKLPPLPPPPKEKKTTFFDVRFVDEIGQAISGVSVEYQVDGGFRDVTTNAAGVALLEDVKDSTAKVSITEVAKVEKVLEPRWRSSRPGAPRKEANTMKLVFVGAPVGPLGVKAVLPHTVVLEPPLGRLFVELWDKTGRLRHVDRPYTITGPMSFQGTTDSLGRLVHDGVLPGTYQLELTVEHPLGIDKYQLPLMVLDPSESLPQVRMVGAVPASLLARIRGLLFETNKTFILPTALDSLTKIRGIYEENDPGELLLVGHTDTTGDNSVNDPLSLDRAENVRAYLEDDVETWFKFYSNSRSESSRWGKNEDLMMIQAMPDFVSKPPEEDPVVWFQRTRGLEQDGVAGPNTRRKLIGEYMLLDGVSLSEGDFDIKPTSHGCGEHFPLDETGEALDTAPEDEARDQLDRRVELFFFDKEFGINPKPPGKNSRKGSPQYPKWRENATLEFDSEIGPVQDFFVRIHIEPEELARLDERFLLYNDSGSFTQEKSIADAIPGAGFVDLLFTEVPISGVYSLEVFRTQADPYLLFESVPFAELDGHIEEEEVDEAQEEDDLQPVAPDEAEEEAANA
jgi:flagellar motor protein MotB